MKNFIILLVLGISLKTELYAQYSVQKRYYQPNELLYRLEKYRDSNVVISYRFISPEISVSNSVKNKLLALLKNEWTKDELTKKIENYLKKSPFKDEFEFQFWNKGLKDSVLLYSMKRRIYFDSAYHLLYDSSYKIYKNEIEKQILKTPVREDIVLACAFADIKESKQILIDDINLTKDNKYDKLTAFLALAKLGDTSYQNYFLKKHKEYQKNAISILGDNPTFDIDFKNLTIIGTQNSVYAISDWLDTAYVFEAKKRKGLDIITTKIYASNYVVFSLYSILQNKEFHDGLKKYAESINIEDDWGSLPVKVILFTKEWLRNNRGKYEL